MKATIWRLSQRTDGWCESVQRKNLSTFGVGGESHRVVSFNIRDERSEKFCVGNMLMTIEDSSDNMGGNAEDIAFRPIHVKPFYVYWMKGFLFSGNRKQKPQMRTRTKR